MLDVNAAQSLVGMSMLNKIRENRKWMRSLRFGVVR